MAVQKHATLQNQTVILDGNEFHDCELRHCNLVFKGHSNVKLDRCTIVGCTWQFEDAAQRTVALLKHLYQSGHLGKEIVEAIFRSI